MKKSLVYCGQVLTPDVEIAPGAIEIQDGRISQIYHVAERCGCDLPHLRGVSKAECAVYEPDATACPGFIDIHVHGAFGHNAVDGTTEAINAMAEYLAKHGVTSFLPTTLTLPWAVITKSVETA